MKLRRQASAEQSYHDHVGKADAIEARQRRQQRRGRRGRALSSVPAPRPITPTDQLPEALR